MNSGGLGGSSLGTLLEPIEALLRALGAVLASSRPGDVSGVDENLPGPSSNGSGLVAHGPQHGLSPHHTLHHAHGADPHAGGFPQLSGAGAMLPFHESQLKIADAVAKVEHEVATVNQDMAYFRHVVDFQNLKIEKLTLLLLDLLHNKDVAPIVAQLQGLQASDPFNVDDGPDAVDDALPENVHEPVHDQVHESVHDAGHGPVHDVTGDLPPLLSLEVVSVGSSVGVGAVLLDSNMDPQLHNVAQAAVQAQAKAELHGKRADKRPFSKVGSGRSNGAGMARPGAGDINSARSTMNGHDGSPRLGPSSGGGAERAGRGSKHLQHLQHQLHLGQGLQLAHLLQEQQEQHSQQLQKPQAQLQHHSSHLQHSQHSQHSQHQGQRQQGHAQLLEHNSPRPQQDRQGAREDSDRSMSVVDMPGLEVVNINGMNGRKKPKVTVDFLHNPMTVKEIYDEFTVGFRGQPPLREMDERYGRHEWRGDSRSKESKRFQRRKKLCDAIERGMQKYGKTAEEIQAFIEDFRGDKSLTWVMNGNLPSDLLE